MLTEMQFESFLEKMVEKISWNQQDRERMVRMETKLDMISENESKCKIDMITRIAEAKTLAEKSNSLGLIFAGGLGAIGAVFGVVTFFLRLTGKM